MARIRGSWAFAGLVTVVAGAAIVGSPWSLASEWPAVIVMIVLGVLTWRLLRQTERATDEWYRGNKPFFTQWLADEVSAHLHRLWSKRRLGDLKAVVKKVLVVARARHFDHPLVFCFGPVDVPDSVPEQFEPFVIEPTRRLWDGLSRAVPFMLAYLGLLACNMLFGRYLPARIPMAGFAYCVLGGVGVLVVWAWHAGVRPYYVRLAPGLIQVVRYTVSNDRPAITEWPIDGKTTVVVRYASGSTRGGIQVTILRGDHEQELDISAMRSPDEVATQFWQAVLSTAPTPSLPDDRLLG